MSRTATASLALNGGEPAVRTPLPPMFPGGMRIGREEEEAVLDVLRSKRLFRYYGPGEGPSRVDELERAFAARLGSRYSLAVSSGTAALLCGLAALAVGPGDEVIVPAYTWIATAAAVTTLGAVPVVAEVDESLTLDPEDVRAKITPRTKAVVAVHMRGAPCAMRELGEVCAIAGLGLLEDTAQACGGSYDGKRLGTIGHVGAFSFQFNKIITSGEGGMVTTNDERIYWRSAQYHDVFSGERCGGNPEEMLPAMNLRMPELLGAVALVQLQRLDTLLHDMRIRKEIIKTGISEVLRERGAAFRTINDPRGDTGIAVVFFMPRVADARWVVKALRAEGVGAANLYAPDEVDYHVYRHWAPIVNKRTVTPNGGPWRWHDGPVRYDAGICARSLELLSRSVHFDVSPDLTEEQVVEIAEAVNKVVGSVG